MIPQLSERYFFLINIFPKSQINYKYTIKFQIRTKVDWKVQNGVNPKLLAFGIMYNGKQKWFHMRNEDLWNLYEVLRTQTSFANIENFYQPVSILGGGSSCQVFLVKNHFDQKLYANKCLRKDKSEQSSQLENLEQEVAFLKYLNHPNIVQFRELFDCDIFYHIICEYVPGDTLSSFFSDHNYTLQPAVIQTIMKQLLNVLEYLDLNDIIHRDIKMDNILITNDNSIKVIDFGLAIHAFLNTFSNPKCGTPGYMAPEVANLPNKQSTYTTKSDIFSAGVIFYKLLTGKSLFQGEDSKLVYALNKKCSIASELQKIASLIPEDAHDLLRRMLSVDPMGRIRASEALDHRYITGKSLLLQEMDGESSYTEQDNYTVPSDIGGLDVPKMTCQFKFMNK